MLIQKCLYTHRICSHTLALTLMHMRTLTHTLTHSLLCTRMPVECRLMSMAELTSALNPEAGQTWLLANHPKRNVRTERNSQEHEMGSEGKVGSCQSSALSLCPFATQPEGSKPGSALCTRKLHLLSGNLVHLRKGWGFVALAGRSGGPGARRTHMNNRNSSLNCLKQ